MKQDTLFKPANLKRKEEEKENEEITLPDISAVVKKSKQVLARNQTKVCRVCGKEDCFVAARIPKDKYVAGRYSE